MHIFEAKTSKSSDAKDCSSAGSNSTKSANLNQILFLLQFSPKSNQFKKELIDVKAHEKGILIPNNKVLSVIWK